MLFFRPVSTRPILGVMLLIPWVILLLLLVVRRGTTVGLGGGYPSSLLLEVTT